MNTATNTRTLPVEWRDFFTLTKPRVMTLVIFTAICGLLAAPGSIHPVLGFTAILAIAMGAGGSAALNHWWEAELDAGMKRTANRPVPSGRMRREDARDFGIFLSAVSVFTMGVAIGWLAAGLLFGAIVYYAVIYTMWLKRSTPQNIVIGGAAGAFPPMVGWAAVTGGIGIESVVLFAIIFLWTPPHFWALALFKLRDYEIAGMPMMPNVAGERRTKLEMLVYSVLLAVAAVLPWRLGFAGPAYGVIAIVLGANFIRHAVAVWRMPAGDATMLPAKTLFGFSLTYLFAIFATLLVETVIMRVLM